MNKPRRERKEHSTRLNEVVEVVTPFVTDNMDQIAELKIWWRGPEQGGTRARRLMSKIFAIDRSRFEEGHSLGCV